MVGRFLFLFFVAKSCVHVAAVLTVVAVGPTGNGKSETCNTLVGRKTFSVSGGMASETREISSDTTSIWDTRVKVFDTPGFFDTGLSSEEVDELISPVAQRSEEGIDVFLFTIPGGRWSEENSRAFEKFKSMFGEEARARFIPVFTRCGQQKEQEMLEGKDKACAKEPQSTLCHIFTATEWQRAVCFGDLQPERKQDDRERLFRQVLQLVQKNGNRKYSSRAFENVRRRRDELRRQISQLPEDLQSLPWKLLEEVSSGRASEADVSKSIAEAGKVAQARREKEEQERKRQQQEREEHQRRQEALLRQQQQEREEHQRHQEALLRQQQQEREEHRQRQEELRRQQEQEREEHRQRQEELRRQQEQEREENRQRQEELRRQQEQERQQIRRREEEMERRLRRAEDSGLERVLEAVGTFAAAAAAAAIPFLR